MFTSLFVGQNRYVSFLRKRNKNEVNECGFICMQHKSFLDFRIVKFRVLRTN